MDKNKILFEIESRLKKVEQEYVALGEAYNLISKAYAKAALKPIKLKSLVRLAEKSAKSISRGGSKSASASKRSGKSAVKRQRSSNGFSKNVVEFFRTSGKFQTTSAIANKFKSSYPDKSEIDLNKYLAVVLSQLKSKGLLSSYSPENKGQTGRLLMWGLPEWMDGTKPKSNFVKK